MSERERARGVAAQTYYNLRWADDGWLAVPDVHREAYFEVVDAILAALGEAGLVVVDRGRLERLQAECRTLIYRDHVFDADLDPVENGSE